MDVNLIISKIRNLFSYLASTLLLLSCSNMAVKEFKPNTYFSRKVDLEMAMADAIYYGEKKLVRDYINTGRVDINRPGKAGFTFLMYAVYIEQYDVAKVLLENGADPNILSIVTHPDGAVERLTPLSCVCENNWYPIKYIKLLVENGANINDTITAPFIRCITYSIKDQKKSSLFNRTWSQYKSSDRRFFSNATCSIKRKIRFGRFIMGLWSRPIVCREKRYKLSHHATRYCR